MSANSTHAPCIQKIACRKTSCSHTCRFLSAQAAATGHTRDSLLNALPYKSRSKAAARLDHLSFDCADRDSFMKTALCDLLALDAQQLKWTLIADREENRTARENEWRLTFKPYARALFTTPRPRSITCAGAAGAGRLRQVDLSSVVPEKYHSHALHAFHDEEREQRLKAFFFDAIGIQIAFTPDYSEFFTWKGEYITSIPNGHPSDALPGTRG